MGLSVLLVPCSEAQTQMLTWIQNERWLDRQSHAVCSEMLIIVIPGNKTFYQSSWSLFLHLYQFLSYQFCSAHSDLLADDLCWSHEKLQCGKATTLHTGFTINTNSSSSSVCAMPSLWLAFMANSPAATPEFWPSRGCSWLVIPYLSAACWVPQEPRSSVVIHWHGIKIWYNPFLTCLWWSFVTASHPSPTAQSSSYLQKVLQFL